MSNLNICYSSRAIYYYIKSYCIKATIKLFRFKVHQVTTR